MSALIEAADLTAVVGAGKSSRTVKLGVQVGDANLGWTARSSQTDFGACVDYVRAHRQPERDCDRLRGFEDLSAYPRMSDSSVHGAGTPTR